MIVKQCYERISPLLLIQMSDQKENPANQVLRLNSVQVKSGAKMVSTKVMGLTGQKAHRAAVGGQIHIQKSIFNKVYCRCI